MIHYDTGMDNFDAKFTTYQTTEVGQGVLFTCVKIQHQSI